MPPPDRTLCLLPCATPARRRSSGLHPQAVGHIRAAAADAAQRLRACLPARLSTYLPPRVQRGLCTSLWASLCAALPAAAAAPAQAAALHAAAMNPGPAQVAWRGARHHHQPAAKLHPAHRAPACRRHRGAHAAPAEAAAAPAAAIDPVPQPAWTVYAGVLALRNRTSMADLSGMNTPPGLQLQGGDSTTTALGIVRRLGDQLSVELALGVPPSVSTAASGSGWARLGVADATVLARADVVSPTLFLNWHPFGDQGRWSPFVGVGLNYTHFADTRAQPALNATLGPTELSLSDSWGGAAHAGLRYRLSPRWSLLAAVSLTQIDTTLHSTSSAAAPAGHPLVTSRSSAGIHFRPLSYTLALGYSF